METDQLVSLVRRHRELQAVALEVKAEQDRIKDLINASVEVGWSLEIDGVVANKRNGNRKFSMLLAMDLLTPDEKIDCVIERYDEKSVRMILEQKDLLDAAMEDVGAEPQVRLS